MTKGQDPMRSPMIEGLPLAAALLASGASGAVSAERPVKLVAVEREGRLAIEVIGQSTTDIDVSYQLELRGDVNGNRVSQSSRAALKAGDPARTLSSVRVSDRAVRGDLTVSIGGGETYVEHVTNR